MKECNNNPESRLINLVIQGFEYLRLNKYQHIDFDKHNKHVQILKESTEVLLEHMRYGN